MSQPGKQRITIRILPNTSRSKDNQTKNSGHLIEYNMRNIFLEKSYAVGGGKSFSKNSKLIISLDQ